jgi:hypothetical protein
MELKERIGIILRSTAQFFAMSLGYLIIRGLLFKPENGEADVAGIRRIIIPVFLTMSLASIFAALIYSFVFPIKSKAKYNVIIPLLILVIIAFELFFFPSKS